MDFDPLAGVEPDGRIPRAERPADLEHPERWRYIPEGRIPPGGFFDRLFVTSILAPFAFRSTDAGFGGGLAVGDMDFRAQRRREILALFGSYTTRNQQGYGFSWRRWLHQREQPGGGLLQEERGSLWLGASYSKTRTRRFFGIGPKTDERDETRFTDELVDVELGGERAFPNPGDELVLRGSARVELHELSGGLGNDPDTQFVFPSDWTAADNQDIAWLQLGARWDTRDSQRNPYSGWHVGALAEGGLLFHGSEPVGRLELSASQTLPLPGLFHGGGDFDEENPATDTLAFGLRAELTAGDLPFFAQPQLGGARGLRGFVRGRFRDDASWLGLVEYRFWVLERGFGFDPPFRVERVGMALFYEAGAVARDGIHLFGSRVRHSGGLSLIASLERAWPFRIDVGFSEDGVQVTAGLGLSL